jgi:hypothetical protein
MKAWAIISVARQVDGEYCVVKVEKAFTSQAKAGEYAGTLAKRYAESIKTSGGQINCVCERGVFELDIESD